MVKNPQVPSSVTQDAPKGHPDALQRTARRLADQRSDMALQGKRDAAAAGALNDVVRMLRGEHQPAAQLVTSPRIARLEARVARLADKIEDNHLPPALRQSAQGDGFVVYLHQQRPWVHDLRTEQGIRHAVYLTRRQVAALVLEAKRRPVVIETPAVVPPIGQRKLLAAPVMPPTLLLGPGGNSPTTAEPAPQAATPHQKGHQTLIQALYAIIAQPCVTVSPKGPTLFHIGTRYQYHQVIWSSKEIRIVSPKGISTHYPPVRLSLLERILRGCQRRFWAAEHRRFESDLRGKLATLPGALYIERSGGKATIHTQADERAHLTAVAINGATKLEAAVPAELYLRGHGPAWGSTYAFGFKVLDDIHELVDQLVEAHNAALGIMPVIEQKPEPRPVNVISQLAAALDLVRALPLLSPEYLVMEPSMRSALVADLRTAVTKLAHIRQALALGLKRTAPGKAQPIGGATFASQGATVLVQQVTAALCGLPTQSPEYTLLDAGQRAGLLATIQHAESVLRMVQSQIDRPAKVGMYARR